MEYMQGGTLAEAVERYSFAESSVAYVAREVASCLLLRSGFILTPLIDFKSSRVSAQSQSRA